MRAQTRNNRLSEWSGLLLGMACLALLTRDASADSVLFDNGAFSGTQEGRNASGNHWVLDDFFLSAPATITAFEWSQHDDLRLAYSFTEIAIYGGFPSGTSLVVSWTGVATRTPNTTPVLFTFLYGFDYVVAGLSIGLGAGTYWLAVRSQFPGGGSTWDQTVGTAFTTAGRFQWSEGVGLDPLPGKFYTTENSAFRVLGVHGALVPEPASVFLVATALALLALHRSRAR